MFIVMDSREPHSVYGVFDYALSDTHSRKDALNDALDYRDRLNQKMKRTHQTVYVYELSQPELES
jgi:hypothetical protein